MGNEEFRAPYPPQMNMYSMRLTKDTAILTKKNDDGVFKVVRTDNELSMTAGTSSDTIQVTLEPNGCRIQSVDNNKETGLSFKDDNITVLSDSMKFKIYEKDESIEHIKVKTGNTVLHTCKEYPLYVTIPGHTFYLTPTSYCQDNICIPVGSCQQLSINNSEVTCDNNFIYKFSQISSQTPSQTPNSTQ